MHSPRIVKRPTQRRRVRSLLVEQLESRRLLASIFDSSPEESTRVGIELLVTDQHGFPISQVEQGKTFKLQAWVRDAQAFAAYTDVEFDAALVSATGEIDHGFTFVKGRSGVIGPGLLDEVGGFRDLENGPSLSEGGLLSEGLGFGLRLFDVIMTADIIGQAIFSANPADNLPAHEIVLVRQTLTFGSIHELTFSSIPPNYVPPHGMLLSTNEDPLRVEDVFYGEVTLEIVEPGSLASAPGQNPVNPFDVNNDGNVSRADATLVSIARRCPQDPDAQGCDTGWFSPGLLAEAGCQMDQDAQVRCDALHYPDVDGDGEVTRHDWFYVLSYQYTPAFAGTDVYVARLGQPLAISAAAGVLANDFSPAGRVVTANLIAGPPGLTLSPDGSFIWTPPAGFDDDQIEFTYSTSDGKRSVNATAQILMRDIDDERVVVSLRTVDATGEPIHEAAPGDTFFLEAYVEDTRPRPEGVFAAYIDVAFDPDLATAMGPFSFGSTFPNARHGSAGSGLLDEVGGLQKFDDYHGGGPVRLFSIPLIAEAEGELTFASDMADTFPEHYLLLLGMNQPVPAESTRYGSTSLKIIDKNRAPIAQSDRYFGQPGTPLSITASGGVLSNDLDPDQDNLSVSLVEGPTHGTLVLEPDGSFSYTPAADFAGIATFQYFANDGEFNSEITSVTLDMRGVGDARMAFRLQVLNDEGQPVDRVTVGDEFELRAILEDLREHPQGVFAAYMDVEYNASLVATVGEVSFGETYNSGKNATYVPGIIDEVGAFTSSVRPLGGGEFFLFSQRFTATSAGGVLFTSNPADLLPQHEVLMFGLDGEIDPDDIDFGDVALVNVPFSEISFSTFSLRIVAEGEEPSLGVADSFAVPYQVAGQTLDVLANDSAAVIAITAVAGSRGSASIAADGRGLLYSAPADFAGHDRFTYTVTDATGRFAVVAVDVQVKSPFQNFASPMDTDSDGHIVPLDALYGVNELNRTGPRRLTAADATLEEGLSVFLDVNGDLHLSPLDVLIIINELNKRSAANSEGEADLQRFAEEHVASGESARSLAVRPDLATGPSRVDTTSWTKIETAPTRREEYFARSVSNDEALLDDDLLEMLVK